MPQYRDSTLNKAYSSEYVASFKMNDRREELFRVRFIELECAGIECLAKKDWMMASMYFSDLGDMVDILYLLSKGTPEDTQKACERFQRLDTAARDKFPDFIVELAGWGLRDPNPEETLEGTKHGNPRI